MYKRYNSLLIEILVILVIKFEDKNNFSIKIDYNNSCHYFITIINQYLRRSYVKIESNIQIKYNNIEDASIVFESLNIDNKGFVESEIDDLKKSTINFNINSDSLSTFLATVDDLILCETLIEDVLESINKSKK